MSITVLHTGEGTCMCTHTDRHTETLLEFESSLSSRGPCVEDKVTQLKPLLGGDRAFEKQGLMGGGMSLGDVS